MLHLSCCGCSERDSGFDGGVQRAERAACRRYAIMVGSFPSRFFDGFCGGGVFVGVGCYHNRVSTTHYRSLNIVTPHKRYLRHRLCGANHNRVSPTRCSFHSPPHRPTARHRHNPHHKLTSLLPLTSYPLPHRTQKKGRHPVAPPHILTSIANLRYFTITFAAVPAVRTM